MLTRRIIPCLDVSHGRVVKGVRFTDLRDAGSPPELAEYYENQGADEIVILDVSATPEARGHQTHTVESVRARLSIPLTVGGGVRSLDDAARLLNAGADKVSINTAAVENPNLISEMSSRFGSQCTVLAIDACLVSADAWQVVTHSGKKRTTLDVMQWAKEAMERGAGEILLTSFDRDGTRSGYDLPLLRSMNRSVNIPVIASGGAASAMHIWEAFDAGADAVLAASIFHDRDLTVGQVKAFLLEKGITIRS